MSVLITNSYRDLNASLHSDDDKYGAGGHKNAHLIAEFLRSCGAESLLDYGCGKGTLKPALKQLLPDVDVREYDPAVPGKSGRPETAQVTTCLDVMEHIEPDCLDAVLDDIKSLTTLAVFMTISTVPAEKQLADGRNAHLIVENHAWWRQRLDKRFSLAHEEITDGGFLFVGQPAHE